MMISAHHECELEEHVVERLEANGWLVGHAEGYDIERALYPEDVIGWIKATRPEVWEKLARTNGSPENLVLDRLVRELEAKNGGTLHVLRKGMSIAGAGLIPMSQPRPEDVRNEAVVNAYQAVRLRVVPQVRYSTASRNSIDLVLFINGIPVATVELKTDFTQSIEAAVEQYRADRSPRNARTGRQEPLLAHRRGAVVHFAMSDTEIMMATRLEGGRTVFLPFNRGNAGGAGNPVDPAGGYPVSYFWNDVLAKDSWLRIFHSFIIMEKREAREPSGKLGMREVTIFPRFHQLEAVNALVDAVRVEGVGQSYLIEHSAGSGKTNTISWTAHDLTRLRRSDGEPYFHTVVVVTDRTVLDRQLQDAIRQIDHQNGIVKAIEASKSGVSKSRQLAEAMVSGVPIVIVTLQTFPYAQKAILEELSLRERRFAVIIDEAHSSTGGTTAHDLRKTLTGQSEEEWERLSMEERLEAQQASRMRPGNVSYFAFTATPKHSTMSLFGRPLDPAQPASVDNPPAPFHRYTMKQAIEEGFILDVLQNYTSYRTALRIANAAESLEGTRVDGLQAKRKIAKWISLHPTNIGQKVQLIVEHFRENVSHLLAGQAKAMIVTSSRAAAVNYKLALDDYISQRNLTGVHAIVAFSGEVSNKEAGAPGFPDDHGFDERNMNPSLGRRDMRAAFDTPDYQVMVVANKFQTGFDQPKLVAMYVDKKVSGVEAVQTLSRLNRIYPGKDRTFVIDFQNEASEIREAFLRFHPGAAVADIQDPNIVYDMKRELDESLVYDEDEVMEFGRAVTSTTVTHEELFSLTQPAADRFNERLRQMTQDIERAEREWKAAHHAGDEEGKARADLESRELSMERDSLLDFKDNLAKYVRAYEYIAQLVDLGDYSLEAMAAYAKLLHKRLKGIPQDQIDLSSLVLTHYAVRKANTLTGVVESDRQQPQLYPIRENGIQRYKDHVRAPLSQLLEKLNNAFGKDITDRDQLSLALHVSGRLQENEIVMAQVRNNELEQAVKADLGTAITRTVNQARKSYDQMALRVLKDEEAMTVFTALIYRLLRDGPPTGMLNAINNQVVEDFANEDDDRGHGQGPLM